MIKEALHDGMNTVMAKYGPAIEGMRENVLREHPNPGRY
jgi:hypothetical protein